MTKHQGFIEVWFPQRGFGFIYENGRSEKLFVHLSNIISGKPQSGMDVRFDVGKNLRGAIALNVEVFQSEQEIAAAALADSVTSAEVSK